MKVCNFIKKRLQHRCFPVNIAKLLKTLVSKNIYERLFLYVDDNVVHHLMIKNTGVSYTYLKSLSNENNVATFKNKQKSNEDLITQTNKNVTKILLLKPVE